MSNITSPLPDLADADLRRRVVAFLASRQLAALRNLEVEAHGGTVTLRGKVQTFYEKQLTQQCSRRVAGVVRLVDEIDVVGLAHREGFLVPIPQVVSDVALSGAL